MRVDLISTGNEIINGEILDSNAAFAASWLVDHGYQVGRHYTCGDDLADLEETIELALGKAGAVICSGGLGPTLDDRTLDAAARVLGIDLEMNQMLLDRLQRMFQRLGVNMSDNQKRQARLPRGAIILDNPVGTACGIFSKKETHLLFCLPGPPNEFQPMLEQQVFPHLERERTRRGDIQIIARRTLCTVGKSEGWVEQVLSDFENRFPGLALGFQAEPPEVRVKLRVRGTNSKEIADVLDQAESAAFEKLGDLIYGMNEASLPHAVIEMLASRNLTLAVAESCTGGLIGKLLTDIPGASKVFWLSAVTYANEMKTRLLEVPEALIHKHGAVSAECAKHMAEGVRKLSGASLGLSVTGIAGPDGGTDQKPVGTIFIAVCDDDRVIVKELSWPTTYNRESIRRLSAITSLNLIRKKLLKTG